jgi:Zn-finger nucleic acid-binding protein
MKCPACKSTLHESNAGGLAVDICDQGCGGIWFDSSELNRVNASGAATLNAIPQDPLSPEKHREARLCPRCPSQVLERKWFSELKQVEIDQCAQCGGTWLDSGEFTTVHQESKRAKMTSPLWMAAMDVIAAKKQPPSPRDTPLRP